MRVDLLAATMPGKYALEFAYCPWRLRTPSRKRQQYGVVYQVQDQAWGCLVGHKPDASHPPTMRSVPRAEIEWESPRTWFRPHYEYESENVLIDNAGGLAQPRYVCHRETTTVGLDS